MDSRRPSLPANAIPHFKLGLLLCDHVPDELAPCFQDYPEMFAKAFKSVNTHIEWELFDITKEELPTRANICDGYLISGSRHSANDNERWINSLILFSKEVHEAKIPIVGLCFGLQILAKTLRGKVEKARQGWGIGHKRYRVNAHETNLLLEADSKITVPVCHQDQITRVPDGSIRIASNDHCQNFIVFFGNHTLGIQGHPEFEDRYLNALIEYKKNELTDEEYLVAKQSRPRPEDSKILRQVILDFLFRVTKSYSTEI